MSARTIVVVGIAILLLVWLSSVIMAATIAYYATLIIGVLVVVAVVALRSGRRTHQRLR